ncbi:MAG: amidohydrolase family protein [Chloroflexota bacterium]|nr:amidohydrolase family protein [Chloroflexota bacterium]
MTLFDNARVLTMDPAPPRATAVLVRDGTVAAVGGDALAASPGARHIDCAGGVLAPAFIDPHCHLLAAAARACSVDCSPVAVRSIAEIQDRLREAAARTRPGAWVRAAGYDESRLEERRHPTRRDLDAAASRHPVRLLHRSGHAVVLNTAALRLAGIAGDTPEPAGGVIDRFGDDGEPSGLLLEMGDAVDRVVPPLPYEELASGVEAVAQAFLSAGVTAICDATHTNGAREWNLFARLQTERRLPLDVTLMEGAAHAGEMPEAPLAHLRRGHVKIMLSEAGGLTPDEVELAHIVAGLHDAGRDVAIHAVEERAVAAAIAAIEAAVRRGPRPHRHRIEHAALAPRGGAARMARAGITVVTQPAFLGHNGDRYLREVPPEKHRRLYPIGSLARAGVRVAASTDAPVVPASPLEGVRAAVERRAPSGATVGSGQAVPLTRALAMWTRDAAWAIGAERERGRIAPGMVADFVLLSEASERAEVVAVYVRGDLVAPVPVGRSHLPV